MSGDTAFLGVERSATGRFWRHRPADDRLSLAISQRLGVPDLIGRLLAARGQDLESAGVFLQPRLKDQLPDPAQFRDMDKAANRLADAVTKGERIAIFGDYDVDGATSAALLIRYLRAIGADHPLLHVPDRQSEGYGPNAPAFLRLKELGAGLAVTVDCGITAFAPLEAAKAIGLDVIVVDHHAAEPALPKALAVVNPNRLDESGAHGQMAAVGVVFLLVVALNRCLRQRGWFGDARVEPDLMQWLDLVALGTVADVVPLIGVNRALVAQGLKVMGRRANPGLRALGEVTRLTEAPGTYHAGFVFGPRVNAGGRIGRADLGARLLITDDVGEAASLAGELDALNTERRAIEAKVLAFAIDMAEAKAKESPYLVFVAGQGWHPGVIGIIAGRLKERYQRPACVIAIDGNLGRGSGRSIAGLHLGNAIIAAREAGIIAKGGGHAMAAGFEISRDRLDDLRAFLETRFDGDMKGAPLRPVLDLDAALQPRAATSELVAQVATLGPFGSGNAEPRFAIPGARLAYLDPVGAGHLRLAIEGQDGTRLKAIAFRAVGTELGQTLIQARGAGLHVAGTLRRDSWQGREGVQFVVEDAAKVAI